MTFVTQDKKLFLSKVLEFLVCKDPILEMLKWMLDEFMKAESEIKVGAEKNKHSQDRKTYFSGYRPRRFDTSVYSGENCH
jgi:hypothetical protein